MINLLYIKTNIKSILVYNEGMVLQKQIDKIERENDIRKEMPKMKEKVKNRLMKGKQQ